MLPLTTSARSVHAWEVKGVTVGSSLHSFHFKCAICAYKCVSVWEWLNVTVTISQNERWTCGSTVNCPSLDCDGEVRMFEPGQCCLRCIPLTDFEGVTCLN